MTCETKPAVVTFDSADDRMVVLDEFQAEFPAAFGSPR